RLPRGLALLPASVPFSILDAGVSKFAVTLNEVEGISYVAKVRPGIYRGSNPNEEGIDALRSLGIRTVINLRKHEHGEGQLVQNAGMRYEWIPLRKTHAPDADQVERFFDVIRDRTAYPIYVHCLYGVDRTGTMMALYRIREQGARAVFRSLLGSLGTDGHDIVAKLVCLIKTGVDVELYVKVVRRARLEKRGRPCRDGSFRRSRLQGHALLHCGLQSLRGYARVRNRALEANLVSHKSSDDRPRMMSDIRLRQ
ncbi:unnamed protein product, partial [Prorocentrum cordatum]